MIALFAALAVAHGALTGRAARYAVGARAESAWYVAAIGAALAYDNAVVAGGAGIGHGGALEMLSVVRFVLHVVLTPTVVMIVWGQAARAGLGWAQHPRARQVAWGVTLLLITIGSLQFNATDLVPHEALGLSTYRAAETSIPIAPIAVVLIAIVVGWQLRRAGVTSWLLAGSVVMFLGAGVPPIEHIQVVGNIAEVAFMAGLVGTEARLAAVAAAAASAPMPSPGGP